MKLRSQPRLVEGHSRAYGFTALPPHVDDELRRISRLERKSVSWVKAEIVCAWFGIDSATGKVKRMSRRTPGVVPFPVKRRA